MLYPNATRVNGNEAAELCSTVLQRNRPSVRGMKNNGADSPYRRPLKNSEKQLLKLNIQRTLVLNG
jgi:hypothetical protein